MIKHIWLQVMWFVVLNAIFFHFYHFHPYPSPGTVKYYHLKKRPEIALCRRISLFYLHMMPNGVIFGIIEQKFEKWQIKIDRSKIDICSTSRITHIVFFGKHHLPHYSKYNLLNYPYYTNHSIAYSLQLYRYSNTVIAM